MNTFSNLIATLFIILVFIPNIAFAETENDVEELSRQGAEAYGEKDYDSAISFYQQAYEKEEIPVLLFNIAKCYEKQKDWKNAKKFFQEYVVAPDVEKELRESALKKIKNIEETEDAEEEQRIAELERKEKKKKKGEKIEEPVPSNGGGNNTLAYVVGGSGVALLVGGGVFGLLAQQQQTTFESATTTAEKQDAQDSGKTMALVADGMFITGGIATAIGIYLFATSDGDDTDPSVSGWISPTSSGANVRFSF